MWNYLAVGFIATLLSVVSAEDCAKCQRKEHCPEYGNLKKADQDAWLIKYPCSSEEDKEYSKLFGFAPIAKGDYVCCSDAIKTAASTSAVKNKTASQGLSVDSRHPDYYNNNYGPFNNYDQNNGFNYPNSQSPNGYDYGNNSPNSNGWGSDNGNGNNNVYNPNQGNPFGYQPGNRRPPKNYFGSNNNPYVTESPFLPSHAQGNFGGNSNQGGQCPVTRFPPKPETGCCGREASDSDRIIGKPKPQPYNNNPNQQAPPQYDNSGSSWPRRFPNYDNPLVRVARSAKVTAPVTVTIGDRIAGGRETELEQFPWTVLLQVTFDYGDKREAFNCGGSLISNRYILTAGHCVFDKGGKVVDVDVYLAEYDKRTFPKDCKMVLGVGQKCIENVVMKAQDFTLHPQYDDVHLTNDIALIRLVDDAPYTDYIRPICLPTIDVDSPEFSNIRLAVAGWGRNGRYRSDIKQSTIVNLVPQEKCKQFYPSLTKRQMCAAGYSGEDTCKGDSGGPLMTLYGGKYEVVGVVSGKRADSPCGTSVPSLYTNVYHYRDWIQSNMKN